MPRRVLGGHWTAGLILAGACAPLFGDAFATVVNRTSANPAFTCFEWPSTVSPDLSVQYVASTGCPDAVDALVFALGQYGYELNATMIECTNAAGMVNFGDQCNETAEAIMFATGNSTATAGLTCDGGFLRVVTKFECLPAVELLNRFALNGTAADPEITTAIPTQKDFSEPSGNSVQAFFSGRSTQWYIIFGVGSASTIVLIALVIKLAVRSGKRLRQKRAAGDFRPARKRVKQGVYTGDDELGFTSEAIKEMCPRKSNRKASSSTLTPPGTTPGPQHPPNVRYQHPDWSGSPVSSEPAPPRRQLKVSGRRRLSSSTVTLKPAPGWESDNDQSLLLY